MKNIFVKGIIVGCIALLMTSCNTNNENPTSVSIDKEQIKKDIQARENQFSEIYNSGELKNIGYYADDAVTFYQNSTPIRNKEDRLKFLKLDLASNSNKISFTTLEVFPSESGLQVLELGYYSVVDSTNTAINTGNYMSLFEKRDGQYVCLRDMSASDMPLD
ncbi:nuclear transport factor 2 family protein [Formosa sp. PL04]|uniref:YybH family protein n=1 Tax=Formosa sp. PL04 TaxID=3081755 RepID=UPI002981574F|nr:nuclear transport factor 2 family protein [Formosa sp. PL04]MDW5287377.1 nuclear transport factor 2 family protein [Formosa sp. PL04]